MEFRAVRALTAIRPGLRSADLRAAAAMLSPLSPVQPMTFASPWATPAGLERIAWSDVFGEDVRKCLPLSRAEAMQVPAVARARHIIAGTLGRVNLRGYRGDAALDGPAEPTWIEQTTGPLSPFHRHLWTADDLFFSGWSLWWRTNGADGFPLRADRLPMGQWSFDTSGNVLVDRLDGYGFRGVQPADVILIPGPHEGLLTFAARSIRIASNIERAVDRASTTPAATLALKQTGGDALPYDSDDPAVFTIRKLIDGWVDARHGRNGGVAFLNQSIEAQELGTFDSHLLVEGRNASAVDIARHASLPADLIDAAAGADLTYANSRDNDRRAVDYGFGIYMAAMTGRLSQDDVTPRGQRVAFDVERWLQGTVPGQPAAQTPPAPAPLAQPPAPAATPGGEPPQ
jgi:hypothetical protein